MSASARITRGFGRLSLLGAVALAAASVVVLLAGAGEWFYSKPEIRFTLTAADGKETGLVLPRGMTKEAVMDALSQIKDKWQKQNMPETQHEIGRAHV